MAGSSNEKLEVYQVTTDVSYIQSRIMTIRGVQVMLDRDLAVLYGVQTKRLNEQVRRNADRFPDGFMFQLTDAEFADWKSQIATSNSKWMPFLNGWILRTFRCKVCFTRNEGCLVGRFYI